jgi:3-phosphoshikimate 1-carboxyvinyltransferase
VRSPAGRFDPAGPLRGTLRPPPDKSISHRAALIAAMGEGEALVQEYLDAADTRSTLTAIGKLGCRVVVAGGFEDSGTLGASITGVGLQGAVCCRGGSPGSRAGPGSSTVTTRSSAARWIGSPSRCG